MKNFDEDTYNLLLAKARDLVAAGRESEEIKETLQEMSDDIIIITAALRQAKTEHYKKLSAEGRVLISVGAFCVLLGFLITCVNFHSNKSFDIAMYGLTTIGIAVVCWGLFKIIG